MDASALLRMPLFPLGTVLFPQGRLPLQIFEVRYLDLIGRCRREDAPFGVVSLVQGSEVEKATSGDRSEAFAPLGTLARIREYAAPMPGLMKIDCVGTERFRILHSEKLPHGLWMAEVSLLPPDPPTEIPEDLAHVARKLGSLIRSLQDQGVEIDHMPISTPFELEDAGWVANRWAELLPIPRPLKQSLLAQESPLLRLELVGDILGGATLIQNPPGR